MRLNLCNPLQRVLAVRGPEHKIRAARDASLIMQAAVKRGLLESEVGAGPQSLIKNCK
jgi:hypothetical protein